MPPATPSADTLKKVAKKLMDIWKSDFPTDFDKYKTGESDLMDLLTFLGTSYLKSTTGIGIEPEQIQFVIGAIKSLQKTLKVDDRDGFFGQATLNAWRSKLRGCNEGTAGGPELPPDALGRTLNAGYESGMRARICYFVEPKMMAKVFSEGTSAIELIKRSWNLWTKHANVITRLVQHEEDANVIIRYDRLDDEGNMLGLANVGGVAHLGQVLTLTMDSAESWTEQKFVAAIAHEMGHILGLTHSETPGQLMNPFLNIEDGIVEPQAEDVERVVTEWGARPTFANPD